MIHGTFAERIRRWMLVLLLGAGTSASHAQTPTLGLQLARAAHDVTAAYLRRAAVFEAGTFDQLPAAASASDLYPAYPFAPSPGRVSWSLTALDTDRSLACFQVTVQNQDEWNSVAKAMLAPGIAPLVPQSQNCSAAAVLTKPVRFPAAVFSAVTLDRRGAAAPTLADPGLGMNLVSGSTTTPVQTGPGRVAAILQSYPGQKSATVVLQVVNQTGTGPLTLTGVTSTPGFETGTTDCNGLAAGGSCSVPIDFNSTLVSGSTAGRVRVTFAYTPPGWCNKPGNHCKPSDLPPVTIQLTTTVYGQVLK